MISRPCSGCPFFDPKMKTPKLSARLAAAAAFVRPGARLIDVGTDHAYLPVFLASQGKVSEALASDIAAGPVLRAEKHIKEYGQEEKVRTLRTPGLRGTADFCPTDIVIAGMGGELISSILADEPAVKNRGLRLILQPMTKQSVLRAFLAGNGFEIEDETLVCEDGRVYQVICASFSGEAYTLTPLEKEIGPVNLAGGGEALRRLLTLKEKQLAKAIEGMKKGKTGEEARDAQALFEELRAYLALHPA